jgi:hypothetical protein
VLGEAAMLLVDERGVPMRDDGKIGALEVGEAGAGARREVPGTRGFRDGRDVEGRPGRGCGE